MAVAPVAAVLLALGAGGAGLVTGRVDLAAAGAVSGAAGVLLEQASSRSSRRRLRQDRSRMRTQIRDLESLTEQLRRELADAPSVLRPSPPPSPTTGPLPIVEAADRAALPATPRSLPILTANFRGLQSCAAGSEPVTVAPAARLAPRHDLAPAAWTVPAAPAGVFAALPGQRPPATPITGLSLPPVEDPTLPRLEPGPAAPLLQTSGVPRLQPGPRDDVAQADAGPGADDLTVIGSALLAEHTGSIPLDAVAAASGPAGSSVPARLEPAPARPEPAPARVVDLRSRPGVGTATATMARTGPAHVDELVFAAIAESTRSELARVLEGRTGTHAPAADLFEPARPPRRGRHADPVEAPPVAVVHERDLRDLADAARHASRGMRPVVPPSPFFTPGAFDAEGGRRHSA